MARNSEHHRRSIRLTEFDYAQPGAYFITICAHGRRKIFSEVEGERTILTPMGEIVREEWWRTEILRPEVFLDQYVIMPNHFHAIMQIKKPPPLYDNVGAYRDAPLRRKPKSLGAIVGQFKGDVTSRVWKDPRFQKIPVWQRNYYERVIRNDFELNHFRGYILKNPLQWELDQYYILA
jgi:putative transposase